MYCGLIAIISVMWCHGLVWHLDNLKVLVLLQWWLDRESSQAIVINNLVLCLRYPGCTKLNTKARNQPTSQPIAIIVAIDWATKRNTSAVDDPYI